MTYRFIEDPGHGWLEVPVEEVRRLCIEDQISGYSYVSKCGQFAYLEEDCDASLFIRAKEARGEILLQKCEYQEHTFVRSLPRLNSKNLSRY